MTKIQYENLTIRQTVPADAKQLAAWWNDGAVMAHAGFPNGLGITEEEVIRGLGGGSLVIEENDRLIGECNYRQTEDGVAEIGIKICETDCQNRGAGRKLLSMLVGWLLPKAVSSCFIRARNASIHPRASRQSWRESVSSPSVLLRSRRSIFAISVP